MQKTSRHLLFWGGIALLLWPLYELIVRIDAMAAPLRMFFSMAIGERIPLPRVVSYIDWSIFRTPAYLLGCMALGACALCLRKKKNALPWMMAAAVLLGVYGYWREAFFLPDALRAVEAAPFAAVCVGCLLGCVRKSKAKGRSKR